MYGKVIAIILVILTHLLTDHFSQYCW